MFAVDARTPGPPLTTDQPLTLLSDVGIVELGTSATWAAHAADVMVDEALAYVADRTTGDEFLPADRVATGCAQLLAFLDGRLVGCSWPPTPDVTSSAPPRRSAPRRRGC